MLNKYVFGLTKEDIKRIKAEQRAARKENKNIRKTRGQLRNLIPDARKEQNDSQRIY